jgi:hypothetical protein
LIQQRFASSEEDAQINNDLFQYTEDAQFNNDRSPSIDSSPFDILTNTNCGKVTSLGCCQGEILWWCEKGFLQHKDCSSRPLCGWRSTNLAGDLTYHGFFDCDTSGQGSPQGLAKECLPDNSDAGIFRRDSAFADSTNNDCGDIPKEGCCEGQVLKYCEEGKLFILSCENNLQCGWGAANQYNCGTAGDADPGADGRLKFPKACPGSPLQYDSQANKDIPFDGMVEDGTTTMVDGSSSNNPGCSCAIAISKEQAQAPIILSIIVALVCFGRILKKRIKW